MEFKGIWIDDPNTKEPSVSLTLLVVSFVGAVVAASLYMVGLVQDTSVMVELFYANCALYFGRKFTSSNGKTYGADSSTSVDQPKS